MRRTKDKSKKLGVRERKIDRIDPMEELRELKEQELRSATGGGQLYGRIISSGPC